MRGGFILRHHNPSEHAGVPFLFAPLLGAGFALILLALLLFLTAALVWYGILPPGIPSLPLELLIFVCAWIGGRIAVQKGRGSSVLCGGLTMAFLCGILFLFSLFSAGNASDPCSQVLMPFLLCLAGGVLAILPGRRSRKKRRLK